MHHHHDRSTHSLSSHRALLMAIGLVFGFALLEVLGSLWTGSLALMSDAGHMASDALALSISAFASWIALKPPSQKHSYGLGRAEIIAAWVSSILMFVVSIVVVIEAVPRIHHPPQIHSIPMIIIALAGIGVNFVIIRILTRGESSLNLRAAMLHAISDFLSIAAVFVSGIIVFFTGWTLIDPILSILISALIMLSSIKLLKEAMTILMEGVPYHLNLKHIMQAMIQLDGVKAIHDLHIWTLSSGLIALSAHVDIHDLSRWDDTLIALKSLLKEHYHIDHITLQPEVDMMECEPCFKP